MTKYRSVNDHFFSKFAKKNVGYGLGLYQVVTHTTIRSIVIGRIVNHRKAMK